MLKTVRVPESIEGPFSAAEEIVSKYFRRAEGRSEPRHDRDFRRAVRTRSRGLDVVVATEVSCRARGDEHCRFVMAHPRHIVERAARYLAGRPLRERHDFRIPDFFARKRMEEELRVRAVYGVAKQANGAVMLATAPLKELDERRYFLARKVAGHAVGTKRERANFGEGVLVDVARSGRRAMPRANLLGRSVRARRLHRDAQ